LGQTLETRIHSLLQEQLSPLNLNWDPDWGFCRNFESEISGGFEVGYISRSDTLRVLNLRFFLRHAGIEILCQKAGEVRYHLNPHPDGDTDFVPTNSFNSVTVWETTRAIFPSQYFRFSTLAELPDAPFAAALRTFWQSMSDREILDKVVQNVDLILLLNI
jgi:hypothetical protein